MLSPSLFLQTCETYALSQSEITTSDLAYTLRTITLASNLNLKALRKHCLKKALGMVIASPSPTAALASVDGLEGGWSTLRFEDYHELFKAVAKGLSDCKADNENYKADNENYKATFAKSGYRPYHLPIAKSYSYSFAPEEESYREKLLRP